jgi:8-oxo-(d)GTP phosphatase
VSIHLVRHASAGLRSNGAADLERPLDEEGHEQARRLVDALAGSGIERILTSPALRCRQTVEPLAAKLGIEIEMVPDLVEGRRAGPVVAMINRLVAAESSAVLSSHGDMIPLVLDALSATGVPLAGDKCQKGSIWELRTADGQILEGRYLGRP